MKLTKKELNILGKSHGVFRKFAEPNFIYKKRILKEIYKPHKIITLLDLRYALNYYELNYVLFTTMTYKIQIVVKRPRFMFRKIWQSKIENFCKDIKSILMLKIEIILIDTSSGKTYNV